MKSAATRFVDWAFRHRETNAITIAQWPNAPLWVFLVASVAARLLDPAGTPAAIARGLATAALVVWAVDELVRGVNPWRRVLGLGVLVWQLALLLRG